MARVILFTGQIDAMSKFYGEVLGLSQVSNEKGWREFDAAGSRIALHSGPVITGPQRAKDCFSRKRRCRNARNASSARRTLWEGPTRGSVLPVRWQRSRLQSHSVVRSMNSLSLRLE
jgi:hypothetical protein